MKLKNLKNLCFLLIILTISGCSNNSTENTSESNTTNTQVQEFKESWELVDEKDRFGDNTGKKLIMYRTKGIRNQSGNDYNVDITIFITKYKIGLVENLEGQNGYFRYYGGRWDLRNNKDKDITLGKIDSWEGGLGFGIIKYSFEQNSQYNKLVNYIKNSDVEIRNLITNEGVTSFKINPKGFKEIIENNKGTLSDGLTKEEKSIL